MGLEKIIYKSEKIGGNGKPFTFYKLITMEKNSDHLRSELVDTYGLDERGKPSMIQELLSTVEY